MQELVVYDSHTVEQLQTALGLAAQNIEVLLLSEHDRCSSPVAKRPRIESTPTRRPTTQRQILFATQNPASTTGVTVRTSLTPGKKLGRYVGRGNRRSIGRF